MYLHSGRPRGGRNRLVSFRTSDIVRGILIRRRGHRMRQSAESNRRVLQPQMHVAARLLGLGLRETTFPSHPYVDPHSFECDDGAQNAQPGRGS
jgi:hypothetical protein